MKDVRKLYASRIVAVDEESHKVVSMLRSKESFNFQEICLPEPFFLFAANSVIGEQMCVF
jgi:hypothetical protein